MPLASMRWEMCGCKVPTSVWEGDERVRLPSRQRPCSAVRPESKETAHQQASVCLQKHSAVRWPMQRTPMTDAACCVAIRTALPDSPHLPPDTISPLFEVFLNRKKSEGEALFCDGEPASPPSRFALRGMMLHPPNQNPPLSEVFSNRQKRAGRALFREKEAASPPSRDVLCRVMLHPSN